MRQQSLAKNRGQVYFSLRLRAVAQGRFKAGLWPLTVLMGVICGTLASNILPAAEPAAKIAAPPPSVMLREPLVWQTDYGTAMKVAEQEKKMLLVLFTAPIGKNASAALVEKQLADPKTSVGIERHVLLKLPTTAEISIQGKSTRLLSHASFSELQGNAGVAVIDLTNPKAEHYRRVVSQLPFQSGKYYRFTSAHVPALLKLPPGTLTQRSMIMAVRTHHEAPASTTGSFDPVLRDEATSHSSYQAQIRNQGHHNWGTRFQRIRGRLAQWSGRGGMPKEVVAESWPQQNLLDSCVDCVDSWRHSSGHWDAVRAQQASYGYDIRQGGNGIWYATGIFSN